MTASELNPARLDQLNRISMWHSNLFSVTLGNFVGGGLFVGVIYWWVYLSKKRSSI